MNKKTTRKDETHKWNHSVVCNHHHHHHIVHLGSKLDAFNIVKLVTLDDDVTTYYFRLDTIWHFALQKYKHSKLLFRTDWL